MVCPSKEDNIVSGGRVISVFSSEGRIVSAVSVLVSVGDVFSSARIEIKLKFKKTNIPKMVMSKYLEMFLFLFIL
jgi:hypothetical protein